MAASLVLCPWRFPPGSSPGQGPAKRAARTPRSQRVACAQGMRSRADTGTNSFAGGLTAKVCGSQGLPTGATARRHRLTQHKQRGGRLAASLCRYCPKRDSTRRLRRRRFASYLSIPLHAEAVHEMLPPCCTKALQGGPSSICNRLCPRCARHESNMRPLPPQGSALSPELRAPGESQCSRAVLPPTLSLASSGTSVRT